VLIGPRRAIEQDRAILGLLLDETGRQLALDRAGIRPIKPVPLALHPVGRAVAHDATARMLTARLAQLILMMLTMILAGMLLSNLIEEKSNKVIEVLAAAVPVDAIFLGKLVAMLAMSLTGLAVWGSVAAAGLITVLPPGILPPPAVGWPTFALLAIFYFMSCYLLLGALFLGIGAQASTVREVQTLSMPVTMAQLGVVGLASTAVADPDSGIGLAAAIFPWSSPFTLIARASLLPDIWPHLLGLVWQAICVALILRFAARRFRRSVLKSGAPAPGSFWRRFSREPRAR
jgi:ABC-2 type transport system permease protein